MAKFTVFGMDADEVYKIPADEYIEKYATSRIRRTYKRMAQNPEYRKLVEKVKMLQKEGKTDKVIKTHVREAPILPEWIGLKFGVYNGKEFVTVEITPLMLNHTLGDFAHTVKRVQHSGPGVGATRGSKFVPLK